MLSCRKISTACTTLMLALSVVAGPTEVAEGQVIDETTAIDQTWRDQTRNSPVRGSHTLRGVAAVDERYAWAVGGEADEDCVLLRTTDGGEHWFRSGCPRSRRVETVHFHDRNIGWAAGIDGTMFKTTDGGVNWFRINSGTSSTITGLYFIDEAYGWTSTREGRVHYTTDGGAKWTRTSKLTDGGILGIHFVNRQLGWLAGSAGLIMISEDGGRTWSRQNSGSDSRIHALSFDDAGNGWTAGNEIRHTTNRGASWHLRYRPSKSLESISVESPRRVWAAGDGGLIYRTTDNGATWELQARGLTGRGFRDIVALPGGTVWVVGTGGTILHSPGEPVLAPTLSVPPLPTLTPVPPPTSTPRPTATPSPTVTPTATPSGPWLAIQWAGNSAPIYVGRYGERHVEAVYGNMPATGVISATIDGAALFSDGEKSLEQSLTIVNGSGRFAMVLMAEPGAMHGATFTLTTNIGDVSAERQGQVAWQALMGWLLRNK